MDTSWRHSAVIGTGILVGVLAGAVVVPWALNRGKPTTPPTVSAGGEPKVQLSCDVEPMLVKGRGDDGQLAVSAAGFPWLITVGKESAAAGRQRDAEVAFINACRAARKLREGAAQVAEAKYQLGRHYAHVARTNPASATSRPAILRRAELLYADSLSGFTATYGAEFEKTRLAAAGLSELRQGTVLASAGTAPSQDPQNAQLPVTALPRTENAPTARVEPPRQVIAQASPPVTKAQEPAAVPRPVEAPREAQAAPAPDLSGQATAQGKVGTGPDTRQLGAAPSSAPSGQATAQANSESRPAAQQTESAPASPPAGQTSVQAKAGAAPGAGQHAALAPAPSGQTGVQAKVESAAGSAAPTPPPERARMAQAVPAKPQTQSTTKAEVRDKPEPSPQVQASSQRKSPPDRVAQASAKSNSTAVRQPDTKLQAQQKTVRQAQARTQGKPNVARGPSQARGQAIAGQARGEARGLAAQLVVDSAPSKRPRGDEQVVRAPRPQPSFDCRKARSLSERLVCADPELARQDRELGRLHAGDKAANRDPVWTARESQCTDSECLRQWYALRRLQIGAR